MHNEITISKINKSTRINRSRMLCSSKRNEVVVVVAGFSVAKLPSCDIFEFSVDDDDDDEILGGVI